MIHFDLETTSIDPYSAEIIEGYFEVRDSKLSILDSYRLYSRPNIWSDEAAKIHHINYNTAMGYPDKRDALRGLLKWLSKYKNHDKYCYANPNQITGHITYDYAVMRMQLWEASEDHNLFFKYFPTTNNRNVYSIVRGADRAGSINVARNPETNRKSFTQENVYYSLFGKKYNAHNAEADVRAMSEIHSYIKDKDAFSNDFQWRNPT